MYVLISLEPALPLNRFRDCIGPLTDLTLYCARIAHLNGLNVGKFCLQQKSPVKSAIASRPKEPDDLIDLRNNRCSDGLGAHRAIIKNSINIARIGKQTAHLLAHW